jgi:adenylate cyclase class 2
MNEIEAKYRFDDFDGIRALLEQCGAEFAGEVVQRDLYFDRAGDDFKEGGCALRVRTIGESGPEVITWKGPVDENSDLKIRPEIEVETSPGAAGLLEAIGFRRVFTIEKRRSSYLLGSCRVELDELPLIGRFVEIEGPSREAVEQASQELGIGAEHVRESYLHLVMEYCEQNGLPPEAATFST